MRHDERSRIEGQGSKRAGRGRVLAAIAIAAAAAVFAGCSDSPETQVAKARDLIEKRDYKAADVQLKSLLQKEDNLEARYLLGVVRFALGDLAGAENDLKGALEAGFDPEKVVPPYVDTLTKIGRNKEAVNVASRYPVKAPEAKARVLTAVARAQINDRKTDEAKASLDAALAAKADYVPATVMQLWIQSRKEGPGSVQAKLDSILASSPGSAEALALKGELEFEQGRLRESTDWFRKAIAADSRDWMPRIRLASALIELKDYEPAQKELDELKKVTGPAPMTMYLQALLDFRQNKLDPARNAVLQSLRGAPKYVPALVLAAQVSFAQSMLQQAESYARTVVEAAPASPVGYQLLVTALIAQNYPDRALATVEQAVGRGVESATLLTLAGQASLRLNDSPKALRYFERASKLDPAQPGNRTGIALAHIASGSKDVGMKELEDAGRALPGDFAPEMQLYLAYMRDRKYEQAIAAANGIRAKLPDKPFGDILVGVAQAGRNDLAAARASFEKALASDPKSYLATANLATLDIRDKKPEEARKRFNALLEKNPKSIPAMLALAQLEEGLAIEAWDAKRKEAEAKGGTSPSSVPPLPPASPEALKWINKAREVDRTSVPALLALAAWHTMNGQPRDAIPVLQEAVATNPSNVQLVDALAITYMRSGQPQQAIEQYEKVAQLRPDSAEIQFQLGRLKAQSRQNVAAISHLRKAAELDPKSFAPRSALVELYLRENRRADARAMLPQIKKDFPKNADASRVEGDILAGERKFDEALVAYRRAAELDPSPANRTRVADALLAMGKEAEAEAALRAVIKDFPDDLYVLRRTAEFYTRTKRWEPSIQAYQEVLRRAPGDAIALNNVAWAQFQLKDPKAIETAERAVKLSPRLPAALDTLGVIVLANGQTERSVQLHKEATSLAPGAPELRLHYAEALIKAGDYVGARRELDTVVKTAGSGPLAERAIELRRRL